jgi:hypothetical protein
MAWPVAQRDPAWITLCHNGRKNVRCAPVRHGGNYDGQPPTVTAHHELYKKKGSGFSA